MAERNSARPAALFLRQPHGLHNGWDGFVRTVDGRFPIALYDATKPFAEQVQGVSVVIDDGGSQHTRAMIDESVLRILQGLPANDLVRGVE